MWENIVKKDSEERKISKNGVIANEEKKKTEQCKI